MNREEAQRFLEERDYCLKHFVKQVQPKGSRKLTCPQCEAEKEQIEMARIEEAIRVLRGDAPLPPVSPAVWNACELGKHPPVNERVYVMCIGFRESGRPGGRETYVVGKPLFWRSKP